MSLYKFNAEWNHLAHVSIAFNAVLLFVHAQISLHKFNAESNHLAHVSIASNAVDSPHLYGWHILHAEQGLVLIACVWRVITHHYLWMMQGPLYGETRSYIMSKFKMSMASLKSTHCCKLPLHVPQVELATLVRIGNWAVISSKSTADD